MIRTLQSTWLALALGVLAYVGTTALVLRPDKLLLQRRAVKPATAHKEETIEPSWAFKNPEVDEMLADLRTQREALQVREQELNDLAARLAIERQEIGTITQRVVSLQAQMDQTFVRIQENELTNLKRLAKVYAAMSPEGAAKILTEFQDDAAVKVLALMKESETAPILENMAKDGPATARRVALISDRLRLLSVPPTVEKPKATAAPKPLPNAAGAK
jgi:flagellar motility protein MotE (MotC chaperone)